MRLLGANVGGDLYADENAKGEKTEFENEGGKAFNADGLTVKGNLSFEGAKAKGEVRLLGASVEGQLIATRGEFVKEKGYALNLQSLKVADALILRGIKLLAGRLCLLKAHVGVLADGLSSWPRPGKLELDGFVYDSLTPGTPAQTAKERLNWLRRQLPLRSDQRQRAPFYTQPYEQLARVFRNMGQEADARKILMEKQNDLYRYGTLGFWAKAAN